MTPRRYPNESGVTKQAGQWLPANLTMSLITRFNGRIASPKTIGTGGRANLGRHPRKLAGMGMQHRPAVTATRYRRGTHR